jgi:hypothetical protein
MKTREILCEKQVIVNCNLKFFKLKKIQNIKTGIMRINYLSQFLQTREVECTLNNVESFNGIYSMEYGI